MKNLIQLLLLIFTCIQVQAQIYSCSTDKRTKVFLLGTFHFAQTDSTYDITSNKHQKSIKKLANILVATNPNKIFVERQPEYEFKNKIDSLYNSFVRDNQLPGSNEIYQLGFRAAKKLNHPTVYSCDHPGNYGRFNKMTRAYAKANKQMDILQANQPGTTKRADGLVNEDSLMHQTTLLNYIRWINSDDVMRTAHAHYTTTYPQIGSTDFYDYENDDTLIGAELLADWYRRNIMIYSKIINQLDYSEEAICLIIGADHVPIIKNLFQDNPHFNVIDASRWLGTQPVE